MYTGSAGMVAQMHRMDILSNNLANVDLNGYKRDTAIHKSFPELLIRRANDNGVYKFPFGSADMFPVVGKLGTGVELNESYTDFTQGAMKETGNSFDLALEGEGFFVVQTPQGERYTRTALLPSAKRVCFLLKTVSPFSVKMGRYGSKEQLHHRSGRKNLPKCYLCWRSGTDGSSRRERMGEHRVGRPSAGDGFPPH